MYRSLISALGLVAAARGAVLSIDVGKGGSVKFNPNSLTAAVGDQLEFHFYSGSGGHSVVSSTFASPCVPKTDAFFSGFIPGNSAGDTTFVVNVTSTDPIWFYCALASHCQGGMVGVVNPPSGETVDSFASAAQGVSRASAPASSGGGVLTTIAPGAATTSIASTTGTSTGSTSGATTVPSTTGSSASAASTSGSSNTSVTPSAAITTHSGTGMTKDMSVVLALTIIMGGLVALLA